MPLLEGHVALLEDRAIDRVRVRPQPVSIRRGWLRRWLECGGLFVAVGADTGVLARGTEALAAKFK